MALYAIMLLYACSENTHPEEINDHLFRPSEQIIETEKVRYSVSCQGSGPAIFFIHGGYLDQSLWADQLAYFSKKGFRACAYDEIGHGDTYVRGDSIPLAYQALRELMDQLSLDSVHLVGLSWGAMVAVDFSLAFPEMVQSLALVSPGLNGHPYFTDSLAAENNALRRVAFEQNDTSLFIELFMANWTVGPRRNASEVDSLTLRRSREMMGHTLRRHWGADWGQLREPAAAEVLREIAVPVQLHLGLADALDIHQIVDRYEQDISQTERLNYPDAAHLIPLEEADLFNERLYDFLKKKND